MPRVCEIARLEGTRRPRRQKRSRPACSRPRGGRSRAASASKASHVALVVELAVPLGLGLRRQEVEARSTSRPRSSARACEQQLGRHVGYARSRHRWRRASSSLGGSRISAGEVARVVGLALERPAEQRLGRRRPDIAAGQRARGIVAHVEPEQLVALPAHEAVGVVEGVVGLPPRCRRNSPRAARPARPAGQLPRTSAAPRSPSRRCRS